MNLALSVPEEMRERTEELNVGFNRKERTWEIIVTLDLSVPVIHRPEKISPTNR